ncbi:MAG: hypothetical protein ACF8R7_18525 [Phycisphaerales bacterium JB039]
MADEVHDQIFNHADVTLIGMDLASGPDRSAYWPGRAAPSRVLDRPAFGGEGCFADHQRMLRRQPRARMVFVTNAGSAMPVTWPTAGGGGTA